MMDYKKIKRALQNENLPSALIDLDALDANIHQILRRAGNKKVRVATKSIRSFSLIKRILASSPMYNGLMCYHPAEAAWLAKAFSDSNLLGEEGILIGYPYTHIPSLKPALEALADGLNIIFMVDLPEHLQVLESLGKQYQVKVPVCIDIDSSSDKKVVWFGVRRSHLLTAQSCIAFAQTISNYSHIELKGLMGYEAQIAGVPDIQANKIKQLAIASFKKKSIPEIAMRRQVAVEGIRALGISLPLVNGGGTGSMESTAAESVVTEITAGSGFLSPTLFDGYKAFRHEPAAFFALEITRRPTKNIYTCAGGGYIASGAIGIEKQPSIYFPKEATLLKDEGAGEVQTPFLYKGTEQLAVGDPIIFRHAKAGELCERFHELLLFSSSEMVKKIPTYRGEGKCFV